MPISITKAAEILHLNLSEASRKMPPDVRDSIALAIDALALIVALRQQGIIDPSFRLKGEAPPHNDNHTSPP